MAYRPKISYLIKKTRLSEIADIQTGPFGSQLHQKDYKPYGTPIVTVEHIGDNRFIHDNLPLVGDDDKDRLNKYTLREGDIVFSRVGSVDRRAYVSKDEEGWLFSGRCLRVRCNKSKCHPKYLSYYFGQNSFKEYISMIAVGATMPSINTQILSDIDLEIPKMEEQKAIASVLSSLDDKIDLLHRQNQTLEALAETIFRQWFIDNSKSINMTDTTLQNVCLKVASGGTPSTKVSSYYGGSYNWYSTKELTDCFLFASNVKITQDGLDNSAAKIFPVNTIVIAIYAAPTVGRLGILAEEACFNQAACGLIANEDVACFELIYLFLKSERDNLNQIASGSAQQNLNVEKIKTYPVRIPEKENMTEFKRLVRPLFAKMRLNQSQIRTLETLRDTLLPKLISGEVRVQNDKAEVEKVI